MRVAIVHDWLVRNVGGEKVLKAILDIYLEADVFTLVDFLSQADRDDILNGKTTHTSFIQKLPFAKTKYTKYLPLFPYAIEQFDLRGYDLVISTSHAVAKGVLTSSNQLHICYCHTPMRYAWDLYFQYLEEAGLRGGIKGLLAKYFLHKIRLWDVVSSNRVDYFIANSQYISKRIKKIYRRDSEVIYPPVNSKDFVIAPKTDDFFVCISRMAPYKKVDIIVEAFSRMPERKLVVIGNGEDEAKVKAKGTDNIIFLDFQPFNSVVEYMQKANAFIFMAEEDFGITIVEAQLCGTPVIAYGVGGASETVKDGVGGVLFSEQSADSLIDAIRRFDNIKFNQNTIRECATRFSEDIFLERFKTFVESRYSL